MQTATTERELIAQASALIADGYEITGYAKYLVTMSKGGEIIYISRI